MQKKDNEDILRLQKIAVDFSQISEKCVYAHIESPSSASAEGLEVVHRRIAGLMFVIIVRGTVIVYYNSEQYTITGPAILPAPEGTLLRMDCENWSELDMHLLAFSPTCLQDVNVSPSSISGSALLEHDSPFLLLNERDVPLVMRYFKLIHTVMSDDYNSQINLHIVTRLSAALFYQMILLLYKRVELNTEQEGGQRRNRYVTQFLKLVHLHYTRERSVQFYASKLYVSPKYLSLLVKEATGRSAVRWIDHFVIMEAKNLLRYSGKNIQQVAYALNFANQSSFGKYFKHITGMSPTEFQKS